MGGQRQHTLQGTGPGGQAGWLPGCYCLAAKSCPTLLRPHGLQPKGLLCPWDFPGKNPGVDCHFLLQGVFPTQGSNPHLLLGSQDSPTKSRSLVASMLLRVMAPKSSSE